MSQRFAILHGVIATACNCNTATAFAIVKAASKEEVLPVLRHLTSAGKATIESLQADRVDTKRQGVATIAKADKAERSTATIFSELLMASFC